MFKILDPIGVDSIQAVTDCITCLCRLRNERADATPASTVNAKPPLPVPVARPVPVPVPDPEPMPITITQVPLEPEVDPAFRPRCQQALEAPEPQAWQVRLRLY